MFYPQKKLFFFFFFDSGFLSIRVQTVLKRIRLLVCHSSTISDCSGQTGTVLKRVRLLVCHSSTISEAAAEPERS